MNTNGFNLLLQDFCDYCRLFKPDVVKEEYTMIEGSATQCVNNIRCVNEEKCKRIAENFKSKRKIISIDDVINFFASEIENTENSCIDNGIITRSPMFNGVNVGFENAEKLRRAHIKYCQTIIERIRGNNL